MKIPLKNFQKKAVRRVIKALNDAYENWIEDGDASAVLLVAPTGSGKTLMATQVIEGLLDGSNEASERPTLRILWLTDSPSLNRQSADKMDRYGDLLSHGKNLMVVDDSYDEEVLAAGSVTFAHIQQLTSSASSWWPNESKGKKYALWHAIAKTVRDHADNFLLVIDEAHKGIGRERSNVDRDTIIKTCLEGGKNLYDGGQHPQAPIALVMTATPQKFKDAMVSSDRRTLEEKVDVKDVQEEGLLKASVRVEFAEENQKAHHTLLESGTEDLHRSQALWQEAEEAGFQHVMPALVVQSGELNPKGRTGRADQEDLRKVDGTDGSRDAGIRIRPCLRGRRQHQGWRSNPDQSRCGADRGRHVDPRCVLQGGAHYRLGLPACRGDGFSPTREGFDHDRSVGGADDSHSWSSSIS